MVNARPTCGNNDQRELGLGEIDFTPMFAAAKDRVKYYFSERDPVAIGGPTNFNPFVNTANSAKALNSDPRRCCTPTRRSSRRWPPAP